MVHVGNLIEGIRGFHPQLTWFHEHAELVIKKKREHSINMAKVLEEEEEEEESEELELEETIIG
jgi:hypothetical protein